jgi:glycosyltransferase involved in cell wall biosynthesis
MMIVPLRIAGGSRLKILEAAAAGLPVISTSVGAEGLKFRPGVDLSMADSAEDLTASIVRWIRSPEAACRCAASARQVVEENYSWARLSEQLEAVWQEVATPRAALLASSK